MGGFGIWKCFFVTVFQTIISGRYVTHMKKYVFQFSLHLSLTWVFHKGYEHSVFPKSVNQGWGESGVSEASAGLLRSQCRLQTSEGLVTGSED